MTALAISHLVRRVVVTAAIVCSAGAALPIAASQADPLTSEKIGRLQEQVDQLKARLADHEKAPAGSEWVQAAPWIALGIIGIWVATGWFLYINKERARVWEKHPDSAALGSLTNNVAELKKAVLEVGAAVKTARDDVKVITGNVQELWKTIATDSLRVSDRPKEGP